MIWCQLDCLTKYQKLWSTNKCDHHRNVQWNREKNLYQSQHWNSTAHRVWFWRSIVLIGIYTVAIFQTCLETLWFPTIAGGLQFETKCWRRRWMGLKSSENIQMSQISMLFFWGFDQVWKSQLKLFPKLNWNSSQNPSRTNHRRLSRPPVKWSWRCPMIWCLFWF